MNKEKTPFLRLGILFFGIFIGHLFVIDGILDIIITILIVMVTILSFGIYVTYLKPLNQTQATKKVVS